MRAVPLVVLLLALTGCSVLRAPAEGLQIDPAQQLDYVTRPAVARVGCSVSVRWLLNSDLRSRLHVEMTEANTDLGTVAGSGFVVASNGFLATNAHVVADCRASEDDLLQRAWPKLLGQLGTQVGRLVTRSEVANGVTPVVRRDVKVIMPGGDSYDATIAAYGAPVSQQGKDVAILKVPADNLPSLHLADSQLVSPPQSVLVIGYPFAADPDLLDPKSQLEATYSPGIISARKSTRQGVPVLQISAVAAHGNSGGPVVLPGDGSVIGMMTFGSQDFESFNFAFTSNTILDFVQEARASNMAGPVDLDLAEALVNMKQGDFNQAVLLLRKVLSLYPQHVTAPILLNKALARVTPVPDPQAALRLWAGGGLLAAAVLGALLMLLTGRRRRRRAGGQARPHARAQDDPEATQEIIGPPGALVGSGELQGRYPLTPGGLTVGRDRACDIVVGDQRVSKHHIWVGPAANGRGVEAIDQGSRNGTYLVRHNGRPVRIERAHLLPGDVLWLVPDGSLAVVYEV